MVDQPEGTREGPGDAKGDEEFVRLWLDAIELADKEEKDWRDDAENAVKIYRQSSPDTGDKKTQDRRFNILHANIETLAPALYNSVPIPDVRRRFADPDKTAKAVSDILERCISYSVDSYDFDETMQFAVQDSQLPGRAATRVRYKPYVGAGDTLDYEEVVCEHTPWKHFRHGPGRTWADVPWIAFQLFLTRDELVKLSPKFGSKVNLDSTLEGYDDKKQGDNPKEVFKRACVWEIWDKDSRKCIFIATSYKQAPIRQEDDPLQLMDFFPIPRPLYGIKTSDTLIPIVPYSIYRDQAEELERVTQRIMALTETLKARGIYDGRMEEMPQLSKAEDAELIAVKNVQVYADGGGLEKGVMWWPIEVIIAVLEKLYIARDQIKQTIYEITGIADILRGQTDPNETLGAQQIKQQWGSLRIQRAQAEVARYARDLFRLKAEIIATKFQWQTIQMMTGLEFPPKALQQQAMQAMQQTQQSGQPPAPQAQAILEQPAQEDVEQLLRNDAMRGFRVDVESDSTIRADMTRNQQNMNLFLQGTAQYAQAMGPLVMADPTMKPVVMEVYAAFARNFKLGKQAEDALDSVSDHARKAAEQPPPPNPEQQAAQQQMQLEAQKLKMQQEADQAKLQLQQQTEAAKIQAQQAKDAAQMQLEREKHEQQLQFEREKHQQEMAIRAQEHSDEMQIRQSEMQINAVQKTNERTVNTQLAREKQDNDNQLKREQIEAGKKPTVQIDAGKAMESTAQALVDVAKSMEKAAKVMGAPRKIVRDKAGRAISSEAVL